MITRDSVPVPALSAMFNQVGARALLVNRHEAFELNEVSELLWRLADGTRTVTQISEVVADEYDETPAVICDDAIGLFSELQDLGLIEVE